MANQTTQQVLYDGPRNLVMQFTGICDGQGDESAVVKVHMADLERTPKSVKIMGIEYDVNGGVVQLLWAADSPVPFAILSDFNDLDYTQMGGLTNAGGDTANGDILLSTLGFEAGSSYMVKLTMVKKFP